VHFRLGVAEGYVVSLAITRETEGDAAAYVEFVCPDVRDREEEAAEESDTVGLSGPMAAVWIRAADTRFSFAHAYVINSAYGYRDVFGKPWGKAVFSEFFPRGRMTVKVDVHLIADKHVKAHVPGME
jgi:hypothetical protein